MSPTKEDYLKILFELGGRTEQVPNKEIANRLSISPPTVTEMMNSLVKAGWVVYTPYKGSKLTREGTDYAKKLILKHRLWEVFLVKHLGLISMKSIPRRSSWNTRPVPNSPTGWKPTWIFPNTVRTAAPSPPS